MQYPGIVFLFYFLPALLILYHVLGFSRPLRDAFLVLASLVFLGWGNPGVIVVLLLGILVNWGFGLLLERWSASPGRANGVVAAAVLCNLGILFHYRYAAALFEALGGAHPALAFAAHDSSLPALGIPVFTLQALSYLLDVRGGAARAERSPIPLGVYMAFFPPLVAGPVQRFADALQQMHLRQTTFAKMAEGCSRLVMGIGKAVLLAPVLGAVSDDVFTLSRTGMHVVTVPAGLAWTGLILFSLYMYIQLSGYADMAIGLGGMFGFTFRENFDYPYAARSMSDFWRRWNITLIDWFSEYFRFDATGRHPIQDRTRKATVQSLLLVWALIGLWHGAGWTFVVWGVWHGFFLFFENTFSIPGARLPGWLGRLYVFFVVVFGWAVFRTESLGETIAFLANLFAINYNGFHSDLALAILRENAVVIGLSVLLCFPVFRNLERRASGSPGVWKAAYSVLYLVALVAVYALSVVYLVRNGYIAAAV